MGDATGEAADRLHFLTLSQCFLRLTSLRRFETEGFQSLGKVGRADGNQPLQLLAPAGQHLASAHLIVDISRRSEPLDDVSGRIAHRDGTGAGPGANDNASGTAALLELARTYARPQSETQTAVQPTHTLVFLSTDGGAYGGLGALRYARRAAEGGHVVAVLNLDALAGSGLVESTYIGSDGLYGRADLAGLNLAEYPAVLIELGNMRNADDAARMSSPQGQAEYAAAVVRGITAYLAG